MSGAAKKGRLSEAQAPVRVPTPGEQRRALHAALTAELRKLEARWLLGPNIMLHLVVGHPIGLVEIKSLRVVERRLMELRREMSHVVRLLKGDQEKNRELADGRYEDALEALAKAEDEIYGVRFEIEHSAQNCTRLTGVQAS